MEFKHILAEKDRNIGLIKINRPEVRNALDSTTYGEMERALTAFEKDDEVSVVILTGEGKKSFASGADIKQLQQRRFLDALEPGLQGICKRFEQSGKVIIAAINGFALGGGCELALACDIRIASESAKFGLPELNLAIIPGGGGTQRLGRIVGKGRALDMILTGSIISADRAEQIGLVSKVVAPELLLEEAKEYTKAIVSKGPLALKLAKQVVHQGFDMNLDTALMLEKLTQAIVFESKDKLEGTTAFLEKRPANFKGE
ncbi:enoyl-CoA hydratase/isomerase family protein [Peribacillus sp. NPDC097264]|uniref:enoyl-CoA hydratase/isomerase family protein n=1 Tax=Peribacillus sp. NPDC097264 TaxID=3390616 RepID=UPI003D048317